jgi:hypothetical protein
MHLMVFAEASSCGSMLSTAPTFYLMQHGATPSRWLGARTSRAASPSAQARASRSTCCDRVFRFGLGTNERASGKVQVTWTVWFTSSVPLSILSRTPLPCAGQGRNPALERELPRQLHSRSTDQLHLSSARKSPTVDREENANRRTRFRGLRYPNTAKCAESNFTDRTTQTAHDLPCGAHAGSQ